MRIKSVIIFLLLASVCSAQSVIDVSALHKKLDWNKLPMSVEAAYIQATSGVDAVDKLYVEHYQAARAKHLKVGFMHKLSMQASAADQLNYFVKATSPYAQDLVPLVEIDITGSVYTLGQVQDSIQAFITLCVETFGKAPLLCATQSNYNRWLATRFGNYHLMIGRFTQGLSPDMKGDEQYTLWQYTRELAVGKVLVNASRFHAQHRLQDVLLPPPLDAQE